jgi:hypothetical protein
MNDEEALIQSVGVQCDRIRFLEADEPRPKIAPADLGWLERRFQLTLPPDYREFLLNANGGDPRPNRFRIPGLDYPPNAFEEVVTLLTFFGPKEPEEHSDYDLVSQLLHLDEYRKVETRWQGDFHRQLIVRSIAGRRPGLALPRGPRRRDRQGLWDVRLAGRQLARTAAASRIFLRGLPRHAHMIWPVRRTTSSVSAVCRRSLHCSMRWRKQTGSET